MNAKRFFTGLLLAFFSVSVFSAIAPFSVDYTYEGARNEQGKYHGKGKATLANGDIYIGEFKDGFPTGYGKYTSDGSYEDDPHAYEYEGHFLAGQFHGLGKVSYKSGAYHNGVFNKGRAHGKGTRHEPSTAETCSGTFTNDVLSGQVTCKNKDATYQGSYSNNTPNGSGLLKFTNGNTLKGKFVDGQIMGKAYLTMKDGTTIEGDTQQGKLSGNVSIKRVDGMSYEGEYHFGAMTGQGKITYPNRYSYEGYFFENEPHGKGKMTIFNGSQKDQIVFEGSFRQGVPDGKGTCSGAPCEYTSEGFRLLHEE